MRTLFQRSRSSYWPTLHVLFMTIPRCYPHQQSKYLLYDLLTQMKKVGFSRIVCKCVESCNQILQEQYTLTNPKQLEGFDANYTIRTFIIICNVHTLVFSLVAELNVTVSQASTWTIKFSVTFFQISQ